MVTLKLLLAVLGVATVWLAAPPDPRPAPIPVRARARRP